MKNTLDLNKMGLEPMNNLEMEELNGGGLWGKVIKFVVELVASAVVESAVSSAWQSYQNSQHNGPDLPHPICDNV
jgi:hypothetical protein